MRNYFRFIGDFATYYIIAKSLQEARFKLFHHFRDSDELDPRDVTQMPQHRISYDTFRSGAGQGENIGYIGNEVYVKLT